MSIINLTESEYNKDNLFYLQSSLSELFLNTRCSVEEIEMGKRMKLSVVCPEFYSDVIYAEIIDKVAEIIVIKYKYEFFKKNISISGLNVEEREILLASLIAADLEDDKKYVIERLKSQTEIAIDGFFTFRLRALKNKWEDIVSYMPQYFINNQLKDFITYLIENKKSRVYVDCGKVYDSHFKRLRRSALLSGDNVKIIREILLSNCGEVEISGKIPEADEKYIKQFYGDKIFFSQGYYS